MQLMHDVEPANEYLPAPHGKHTLTDVPPIVAELVPALQLAHYDAP